MEVSQTSQEEEPSSVKAPPTEDSIRSEDVQPPAVSASSSERLREKQPEGSGKQRNKEEVEQSIAALQRSIHCRELEVKKQRAKNEAMAREFASEAQEEPCNQHPSFGMLQPYRIKAFDELLRTNARAVMAAERIKIRWKGFRFFVFLNYF